MFSSIVSALTQPETAYLLYVFVGAILLLVVLERLLPLRSQGYGFRSVRNTALLLFNTTLKLLLQFSLIAASLFALFEQFGILNIVKLGLWTKIVIAWLALDFCSYWIHRAYHRFLFLWRFHQVHHSDLAIDVTTPFRTHPVEMLITLGAKAVVVVLFGMPLLGVVLYEIIVAVMAVWAHANIRIHYKWESVLSWIFVTPGFHLLHHGDSTAACKQNYGLVLTVWDRIFGTVASASLSSGSSSAAGCRSLEIESLAHLLAMPFRKLDNMHLK